MILDKRLVSLACPTTPADSAPWFLFPLLQKKSDAVSLLLLPKIRTIISGSACILVHV